MNQLVTLACPRLGDILCRNQAVRNWCVPAKKQLESPSLFQSHDGHLQNGQ